MKVKILVPLGGTLPNGKTVVFTAGDECDLPDEMALALIAAGQAEPAVKIKAKPKRARKAVKVK